MTLSEEYEEGIFRKYTELVLEMPENRPNLAYESSTHDI